MTQIQERSPEQIEKLMRIWLKRSGIREERAEFAHVGSAVAMKLRSTRFHYVFGAATPGISFSAINFLDHHTVPMYSSALRVLGWESWLLMLQEIAALEVNHEQ